MDNLYSSRIEALRALMVQRGWDAVILAGSDPHASEYLAPRWKQVEWLSGFTGEAGDLVVTADHAGLWTDTRYFIQAKRQLHGTGVELHKMRVPEQVPIPDWLADRFARKDGVIVAVDGLCQQVAAIQELQASFAATGRTGDPDDGYYFRIVDVPDLLDALWTDRPAIPRTPVSTVPATLTGETRTERLAWLRKTVAGQLCDAVLLTSLDEIAWVLNVRASDIDYNPMVISYLLVTEEAVRWYVRKDAFDERDDDTTLDTFALLEDEGIQVLPYDEVQLSLHESLSDGSINRLFVDPASLNWSLYGLLSESGRLCEGTSPVQLRKAVKTPVEIEGMRRAHRQDGVAMEMFLYWLERMVLSDKVITERTAATKLGALRAALPDYLGDSFEIISAYGPGAALPHYITPAKDAPELEARGLYLCDSGGQYRCGTTDITRTVPLGPCTALEREDYTLVLKGHIDLAMAVFPEGTAGCQIDALARNPLWSCKRNFGHGTGHGVGFYLGVHEGPQDIRQNFNRQPLLPGMITSDEPGLYREGQFGVRHENLLLCVEAGRNDFGRWLTFEPLTLCHFETSMLVRELLSQEEIDWLNDYHERVYRTLAPDLPSDVARWLRGKTAAI
ncbi:MAG: aminopeptidase P family protein [Bacteroidales bacterium]|nr:aminopeptidase P family protein [Bacteroidales bacterium]